MTLLRTSPAGLAEDEVERRRLMYGPNRLAVAKGTSALRILANQLSNIVVVLLVVAAALSLALGEVLEAAAIAGVLAVNAALGFVIDLRARRAMEALARLDVRWSLVWRGGLLARIDVDALVPGDVIELETGRTVPADARVFAAHDLRLSEAVLTGESVPVSKRPEATLDADTPLAERVNMLYKGTIVLAGTGQAVVTATGAATEVGRIGVLLAGLPEERTPLERRLDALGRRLVWVTLGVAALVGAMSWLQGLPLGRVIETAIALAVAAVPEGLPAVVTIALASGLRRMAARHALVRRLPAVEALGATTIVCTDKTRTLTSGDMTLVRVWTAGLDCSLEGASVEPTFVGGRVGAACDVRLRRALEVATLASQAQAARHRGATSGDPVEAAIVRAARDVAIEREDLMATQPLVAVVPFSSRRGYMASIHRVDEQFMAYLKGAPIRLLALCDRELTETGDRALSLDGKRRLLATNRALASDGLHVLALARGPIDEANDSAIRRLTFVGFVGLLDPPAEGVREAIARLREAGLATVMLTGDQRATALAVGRRLGLVTDATGILDGREVQGLSDAELNGRAADVRVFSRITPETKLAVVRALQQRGEIVAMIGDGVNDAVALKKADVGVAMGRRGSDVAKEAASIVLEDDRFETIVASVEEGRVIYDNVRKFVFYLFSCNLAEIFVLMLLTVLGLPPLLPLQILWLNLVTDTLPALALALEPGDPDVMRRPPRRPEEALLSRSFMGGVATYAALLTGATFLAIFTIDDPTGPRVTTVAFFTLALAEVFHLGNARSATAVVAPSRAIANRYALGAVAFTLVVQCGVMVWPPAVRLLHLESLTVRDWAIVGLASILTAAVGQAAKLAGWPRKWHTHAPMASRA
jgi:Ca2+-transporting ATPase